MKLLIIEVLKNIPATFVLRRRGIIGLFKIHLLILVLQGCNGGKENVSYIYYGSGKVKKVIIRTLSDTGVVSRFVIFSENGDTTLDYYRRDTILHGFYRLFKDGKLKYCGLHQNGLRFGKWVEYHDNSKVESEEFFNEEKLTHDAIYYSKQGNVIDYLFYDYDSQVTYIEQYSEDGRKRLKKQGFPIGRVENIGNKDSILFKYPIGHSPTFEVITECSVLLNKTNRWYPVRKNDTDYPFVEYKIPYKFDSVMFSNALVDKYDTTIKGIQRLRMYSERNKIHSSL